MNQFSAQAPLIERDGELEMLQTLANNARQMRGCIVQLVGEAGIGKTSLVRAFLQVAGETSSVATGICDALFTPRPLGAVYEIAMQVGGRSLAGAERRLAGVDLFPILFSELQQSKDLKILVIEDVHWADNGTLDFIRYLGRRISSLPVLLIVTYRDNEVGPNHSLTQVLGDLPSTSLQRIALNPLSAEGIEKLNSSRKFASSEILEATGGNPFFVTELLASHSSDLSSVPNSVREAVNARLSRISDQERSFLEAASLIPVSIQPSVLDPLFSNNADLLASACLGRELLKREADGTLRFRHELARIATAERLTSLEQKTLHEKLLRVLLDNGSERLDQIVHHAAGALDTQTVLQYAPLAAKAAAEVGSHREAAAHLSTALEFVSEATPELAATLYENWAYEAGLSLKIDDEVIEARRHAITLWRALGRSDKVGENLRWLSRSHWYRGEAAKAAQYCDDAVEMLDTDTPSAEQALAYSLRAQMHMLNDRMSDAVEWGQKAVDIARPFAREDIVAHALNTIGTAKLFRGDVNGLADMEESLRLARAQQKHEDVARVYTNLSEYAVEFRDFPLAEKILSEGIAYDTEHDLDSWTFYLIGWLARLRLEQGRLQDAKTIADGVLERTDQTLLMKFPSLFVLAKSHLRLGLSDASKKLFEAMQASLAIGELQYIVPIRTAFIEAAALHGLRSDTQEHLDALLALDKDQMMVWRRAEIWFWARACGLSIAPDFYQDLPEPYTLIEDDPPRAAAGFDQLGLSYHAAFVRAQSGVEDEVVSAHKASLEMDAGALAEKCRAIAEAGGFEKRLSRRARGPYSASKSHPLGLTKKEQDVLRELATGATNTEIAETLSRSRRTIENHVSSVLHKLNAKSRTDVILRIQNEPWLLPKA